MPVASTFFLCHLFILAKHADFLFSTANVIKLIVFRTVLLLILFLLFVTLAEWMFCMLYSSILLSQVAFFLNLQADREGYIAIIMPKPADWLKIKASLIDIEEYKKLKEVSWQERGFLYPPLRNSSNGVMQLKETCWQECRISLSPLRNSSNQVM